MTGLVLWSGTLGRASFEQRLAAAAAAGYGSLSVFPWDCRGPGERGSRARELRARAEAAGVGLSVLDPLSTWLPRWSEPAPARDAPPESGDRQAYARLFAEYGVDECLEMASELGCRGVSAIEPYGRHVPVDFGAAAFAALCDRAAEYGLRPHLEFMPFSGIPDLASAWAIVRDAGRRNGGLLLDTWHYFRSDPDDALLASIPAERIFALQLCDGAPEVESDLWFGAAHARRLPGEGCFDLARVVGLLRERGAAPLAGPEVCSDALSALDPLEAARLCRDATQKVLGDFSTPD